MFKKFRRVLVGMVAGVAMSTAGFGCHGSGPVSDPTLHTEGVANPWVVVSKPIVTVHRGEMTVSGDVRRKPGVTGDVVGRVDIMVVGPDGGSLIWVPALITPNPIPTAGRGESQHVVHYGYVPPP